jgi:hypothetical protein
LSADILDLLRSPERRAAVGKAARKWMEQTQRPEATLDTLAGIYQSVAGRK